ncbi:MAG: hypothetical protein AAFY65_12910 [Pseudomonadota bacterium]
MAGKALSAAQRWECCRTHERNAVDAINDRTAALSDQRRDALGDLRVIFRR